MNTTAPLLSPVTAARLAHLDRELDLASPGFAETILAATLENIKNGDHGLILDGYEWEHGKEWAESRIAALVESWKAEDTAQKAEQPRPTSVSTIAAQLAAQDAQKRTERRAPVLAPTEATNTQEGQE